MVELEESELLRRERFVVIGDMILLRLRVVVEIVDSVVLALILNPYNTERLPCPRRPVEQFGAVHFLEEKALELWEKA